MTRESKLLTAIFAFLLGSCFLGCATARPAVVVEAPQELVRSETHVSQQAVHPPTDLSVGFQAIDSDADASPVVASDAGGEDAPETVQKGSHGF